MRFLASVFFCLITFAAWAQPKLNSPYSRFGIGDPITQSLIHQTGMAGQSAAFHDPFHLNLQNPASFAFLRSTALETGLYAKYSHLATATATKDNWSGNLAYLALGFTLRSPINEVLDRNKTPWKFGMGFALTPYSVVGYNIQADETLPDVGEVQTTFQGNGGTYRLQWSNGVRHNNTAFGATLGWMFGKSIYENTTIFNDTLFPTFQDNIRQDIGINGFVWNVGAQQDIPLAYAPNNKDVMTRWITLGLTAESKHKLNTVSDAYFIRSNGRSSNGQYANADTLTQETDLRRNLTLPAGLTFGIQYVKLEKLRLGAQFGFESWSNYKNEARPETFRNTISISAGAEFIPDFSSYNRYAKRVRYRVGGYYRQDPRVINGQGLDDVGVSFGFGFPIVLPRQQTSFVNSAFEIGKLGSDSPIEETYFRISLGFTLNDNTWFYKRRFE
ncbi:MAG: hypothetical protein IPL27_15965 [Lewinellaceae bacterium]|nr:hypothetical protein [Lewinellaceae bacterium]